MKVPAFIKKILILLVGSGLAQALNFVITSILTRKYLPEQFGSQVVFLTIAFYFSVVFTGKYELAVVIPHSLKKARAIVGLCLKLLLGLSLLSLPFFYFFGNGLAIMLKQEEMAKVSWLIPISIIALGLSSVFNYWHTRLENYKLLAFTRILETVLTGGIALLLFGVNSHGLIVGSIIGTSISVMVLFGYYLLKDKPGNSIEEVDINHKELAQEFSDFPKSNVAISLIDAFQFTGIALLISFYFGPQTAGYFALCNRILQAPIGLIIKPITQIFFSDCSKLFREKKPIMPLTQATIKRAMLVSFPMVLILLFFGPFLFGLIFGPNWTVSGTYAQILVFWFFLEFIKAPISQVAVILRKQPKMLLVNLISLTLYLLIPVLFKILQVNPVYFFIYTTVFHIVVCLYIISWFIKIAKEHDAEINLA